MGNRKFANVIDAALLKAPIFGKIVHDAAIARYSRTLSTTFAARVPLVEARAAGIFPMFLLQMTSIGEESGTLDEMLGKVADQYEMQVDNAV